MKNKKYNTIKEFMEDVKSGKINEKDLHIEVDNDGVFFGLKTEVEDEYVEIEVMEANGYGDTMTLYSLLFPEAEVDWV